MFACLVTSAGVFAAVPSLRPALSAYLFGFITVIGNVLYLDWFLPGYRGDEVDRGNHSDPKGPFDTFDIRLRQSPFGLCMVILIQSAGFLTSGIAGAVLACRRLQVALPAPTLRGFLSQLKEGWRTFLATVSINVYTSTNT